MNRYEIAIGKKPEPKKEYYDYEIFLKKKPPKYIYVEQFNGKPLEIPIEDLRKLHADLISESRIIQPIRDISSGHIIEFERPLNQY